MRPSQLLGPAETDRGGAALTVAVLEDGSRLAELLAGTAGLVTRPVGTLDELAALAEAGDVGAAVVDPEAGEGYPAAVADEVVDRLGWRVPLVLVCRSGRDAAVIEARTAGRPVAVLAREKVLRGMLAAVLIGRAAQRQAGAGRPGWA